MILRKSNTNRFRIFETFLLLTALSQFSFCLYYQEKNKGDNSKIYYKDAQQKLIIAVVSLSDRCQSFNSSGFNYPTSYLFMAATDPCYDTTNFDLVKGCSDAHYFNSQAVNLCVAEIASDPCDETGSPPQETSAATNYRFSTFSYCSQVFKWSSPMPMFL